MYEVEKNLERYLRVNLLGPGPRLMKKEFTGPRSHKGWETLSYTTEYPNLLLRFSANGHFEVNGKLK
jgi:hypothetical protein